MILNLRLKCCLPLLAKKPEMVIQKELAFSLAGKIITLKSRGAFNRQRSGKVSDTPDCKLIPQPIQKARVKLADRCSISCYIESYTQYLADTRSVVVS